MKWRVHKARNLWWYSNHWHACMRACCSVSVRYVSKRLLKDGSYAPGLAAARKLRSFGFKVVILEGRGRPGGRVYTKQLQVTVSMPCLAFWASFPMLDNALCR